MSIMLFYRKGVKLLSRRLSNEKPKTVWRRGLLTPNGRLCGTGVPTERLARATCVPRCAPSCPVYYIQIQFILHAQLLNYLSLYCWCGVCVILLCVCVRSSFKS